MGTKKTLVLGASIKEDRYSNMAVKKLQTNGIPVEAVGLREGKIDSINIHKNIDPNLDIHTISLYLGPQNQDKWIKKILDLKPKRIIFNPGTQNPELSEKAEKANIEVVDGCTLVMLSTGMF